MKIEPRQGSAGGKGTCASWTAVNRHRWGGGGTRGMMGGDEVSNNGATYIDPNPCCSTAACGKRTNEPSVSREHVRFITRRNYLHHVRLIAARRGPRRATLPTLRSTKPETFRASMCGWSLPNATIGLSHLPNMPEAAKNRG